MKVTVIPIVIGGLGTVTKGLKELEITGRVKTVQTTALLRSTRILRRILETWRDLCHSNSSKTPSANADVKTLIEQNNNDNFLVSFSFRRLCICKWILAHASEKLYWRPVVTYAAGSLSSLHRRCPRERQGAIQLDISVTPRATRTELHTTSNCSKNSSS